MLLIQNQSFHHNVLHKKHKLNSKLTQYLLFVLVDVFALQHESRSSPLPSSTFEQKPIITISYIYTQLTSSKSQSASMPSSQDSWPFSSSHSSKLNSLKKTFCLLRLSSCFSFNSAWEVPKGTLLINC